MDIFLQPLPGFTVCIRQSILCQKEDCNISWGQKHNPSSSLRASTHYLVIESKRLLLACLTNGYYDQVKTRILQKRFLWRGEWLTLSCLNTHEDFIFDPSRNANSAVKTKPKKMVPDEVLIAPSYSAILMIVWFNASCKQLHTLTHIEHQSLQIYWLSDFIKNVESVKLGKYLANRATQFFLISFWHGSCWPLFRDWSYMQPCATKLVLPYCIHVHMELH